jgi:hypothetical protein
MSHKLAFRRSRLLVLTVSAMALWLILPFVMQISSSTSHAQMTTTGPDLVARLSGAPIGGVNPIGFAAYDEVSVMGSTNRVLHVEVSSVNLPAATQLSIFFNTTNIGSITLDPMHHGVLNLSTANGNTVPTPVAGDALSVKSGTATILGGTFAIPPTPSPTPTLTPMPTPSLRLWAPLMAPAAATVMNPRGLAQYAEWGTTDRVLEVYVSFINLPEGTVLNVGVGGNLVGTITLHSHAGFLRLSTRNGGTVPVVAAGTPISVRFIGNPILAGVFTNTPPPPPPSPSPTVSPTPVGTPVPARAFAGKLKGRSEVPPVATDGRGFGFVLLNPAGDHIGVRVAFVHLSSAVTSITINGPSAPDANGPVVFTINNNGGTAGVTPPQSFAVTTEQIAQLRNGVWYFQVATANNPDGEIRGQIRSVNRRDDFDGDGLSDIGVIRPRAGLAPDNAGNDWYTLNSSDFTLSARSIGQAGDINVQGDYDGDGVADVAMYTPSTGVWQIRRSGTGETSFVQFGANGDVPVIGDYDGDSINDLAVYRPSEGNWYVLRSSDGSLSATHWGVAADRPVTGDFDGDGVNDLAVFRPNEGNWYIYRSSDSGFTALHWGTVGDQPVAGDFDGDGTNDVAVFRPSEGNWYIYRSSDNAMAAYHFGTTGDIPVACEFDGDGMTDMAVFRPSDGNWYINRSTDNGIDAFHFGIATDRPVPAAYTP